MTAGLQQQKLVLNAAVILSSFVNVDNLIYFLRQTRLVNHICWGKIIQQDSFILTTCSSLAGTCVEAASFNVHASFTEDAIFSEGILFSDALSCTL